jgi:hypothetical protein
MQQQAQVVQMHQHHLDGLQMGGGVGESDDDDEQVRLMLLSTPVLRVAPRRS